VAQEEDPKVELHGPLSVLDDSEVAELLTGAIEQSHDARSILLRQGAEGQEVLVILEGRVGVLMGTPEGDEVLIAIRGPGDVLGELALFDPAPRIATVMALEEVRTLTLDGAGFLDFLAHHPHAVRAMLQLVVRRLRETDQRLVDTRTESTATRLARDLLMLGARFGTPHDEGLLLDVPLSQEQLASLVGASREAVNAALGDLRHRGAVRTGRMRITLVDVELLRGLAFGVVASPSQHGPRPPPVAGL
jgi:CRP/FNR family transcriptional regulator, cyclic AMP receptor protein